MKITGEKKVETVELFYDLIFVYAISKLSGLIHHPHNGLINILDILKYVLPSLVVLQSWLYMTNYINRFGTLDFFELAAMCINMAAALYLANAMSNNWETIYRPFHISMAIMMLTVCILYARQARKNEEGKAVAIHSRNITFIVSGLLLAALFFPYNIASVIGTTANILGIVLPLTIRNKFEMSIVNFSHLKERVELLVIITFGEMLVNVAQYFSIERFSIYPFLALTSIFLMFGTYTVLVNKMISGHVETRGLVMMYSHFFLVISLGLIAASWNYLGMEEINRKFLALFTVFGLLGFYAMLFANCIYLKEKYKLNKSDYFKIMSIFVFFSFIIVIFSNSGEIIILSVLLITAGIFKIVSDKRKRCELQ